LSAQFVISLCYFKWKLALAIEYQKKLAVKKIILQCEVSCPIYLRKKMVVNER